MRTYCKDGKQARTKQASSFCLSKAKACEACRLDRNLDRLDLKRFSGEVIQGEQDTVGL